MKKEDIAAYISAASILTTAASAHARILHREVIPPPGFSFRSLVLQVSALDDQTARDTVVTRFLQRVATSGTPLIEDSTVIFLYRGQARRVGIAADFNGWKPGTDTMMRVPGTDLFSLERSFRRGSRFEYKLVVDSAWILDPLNTQTAMGGYGANSEIWMPGYIPPPEIEFRPAIPHGTIDTLIVRSRVLARSHAVFVYLPPGYTTLRGRLPSVTVMDGGEYLSLGLMANVLDNLIADGRIAPVIGIFVDPRTDIRDNATSTRMQDYTLNNRFVRFLTAELRPRIMRKYRVAPAPALSAIMGASLGGLIATYAAFRQPGTFGLCAAQSPSYWWNDSAMIRLVRTHRRQHLRIYIDTGTMRDAAAECRVMKGVLQKKGYPFTYAEYPEGHNWVNWRARIDDILTYFWGKPR